MLLVCLLAGLSCQPDRGPDKPDRYHEDAVMAGYLMLNDSIYDLDNWRFGLNDNHTISLSGSIVLNGIKKLGFGVSYLYINDTTWFNDTIDIPFNNTNRVFVSDVDDDVVYCFFDQRPKFKGKAYVEPYGQGYLVNLETVLYPGGGYLDSCRVMGQYHDSLVVEGSLYLVHYSTFEGD